jgi:hypothetical protein
MDVWMKEGRQAGRKEGRKAGRKEGRKVVYMLMMRLMDRISKGRTGKKCK